MLSAKGARCLGFLYALTACSTDPPTPPAGANASPSTVAVEKAAREYREHYNSPVDLDSTDFYYQPISVLTKDGTARSRTFESGSYYGSDDEGRSGIEGTCYNVVFMRKSNVNEQHLLLPHGQFVIQQIDDQQKPDARWPYLFYGIIKADTNADGEQNGEDATTLFASDRSGRQLRQLTPDGTHLEARYYLAPAAVMLVEVRPDANHDREYTRADGTYWLRFNLRDLAAPPVRQPAAALGRQLHQQMLQRQSRLPQ
ncbi:hypothetical protein HNQ93_001849 [Hymenobacter luteus]|uniref:Lipoprotein n=2 Tax=Hymenobacter TaxID=89966 RepID=A0A7W9WBH7_9BACT|nr:MULTISPECIES: hypothetical protein [Hymenobacter]MBB4600790.1 hypothetical protein [Hymenobacter latericoloratus]MBB6059003.1 hypothetical protein [Hymenobacter luteus]